MVKRKVLRAKKKQDHGHQPTARVGHKSAETKGYVNHWPTTAHRRGQTSRISVPTAQNSVLALNKFFSWILVLQTNKQNKKYKTNNKNDYI